jgi:hypothetical protein
MAIPPTIATTAGVRIQTSTFPPALFAVAVADGEAGVVALCLMIEALLALAVVSGTSGTIGAFVVLVLDDVLELDFEEVVALRLELEVFVMVHSASPASNALKYSVVYQTLVKGYKSPDDYEVSTYQRYSCNLGHRMPYMNMLIWHNHSWQCNKLMIYLRRLARLEGLVRSIRRKWLLARPDDLWAVRRRKLKGMITSPHPGWGAAEVVAFTIGTVVDGVTFRIGGAVVEGATITDMSDIVTKSLLLCKLIDC